MPCSKWLKTFRVGIKKGASIATRPEPTIYGNCDMLELHFREIGLPVYAQNSCFDPLRAGNGGFINRLSIEMVDIHMNNMWKRCG